MASFTLTSDRFPVGTSVGAYPVTNWNYGQLPPNGAAQGAATESATVDSTGTASFSALTEGTSYYAGASISGTWRYVKLSAITGSSTSSGGTSSISGLVSVVPQGITSVENIYGRASDFVLYASAARTASPTAVVLPDNLYGAGLRMTLDITATAATTGTVTVAIQHFDPAAAAAAGRWVTVKSFTAITGSTAGAALPYTVLYTIDRGAVGTVAPHEVFQNVIGRGYRAIVTHSTADSWTYSLGGTVLAP